MQTTRVAHLRGGPGDESGPEMADACTAVLDVLFERDAPDLELVPVEAGASCYAEHGTSLPPATLDTIRDLGVVLKAPTATVPGERPISLTLRRALDTYANVNRFRSYAGVAGALAPDIDVVLVRENTEGLFFGSSLSPSPGTVIDLRMTTARAARRVATVALELSRARDRRLTIAAATSAVPSDTLFVESCEEVAEAYPDVQLSVRKVDAFAGSIVDDPAQYDVVLTPNEWGAILTDPFAAACGAVGLCARANLGDDRAIFEPIHGTAPGKAGKGTVNPISQILAAQLMLEWIGRQRADPTATRAGERLDHAVTAVLSTGATLTVDLGGHASTAEMVAAICDVLRSSAPE